MYETLNLTTVPCTSMQNLSEFTKTKITLGECSISQSDFVKRIIASLDNSLTMDPQISSTCWTAWFYLYQIGKIRKYLREDKTKSIINAHVTSIADSTKITVSLLDYPRESSDICSLCKILLPDWSPVWKKRGHVTSALF